MKIGKIMVLTGGGYDIIDSTGKNGKIEVLLDDIKMSNTILSVTI